MLLVAFELAVTIGNALTVILIVSQTEYVILYPLVPFFAFTKYDVVLVGFTQIESVVPIKVPVLDPVCHSNVPTVLVAFNLMLSP